MALNRSTETMPTDIRVAMESAFANLDERASQDVEELSDEEREGLIATLVKIRPPSADTIVDEKSLLQKIMILGRLYASSVTATNRNHFYPEPWGSLIDMATTGASFESGVILWYLLGSDPHDVYERVKAEGRGGFFKGLGVGLAKIILASAPPALIGFGLGSLINYFEDEINQRPWLQILCNPPVARFITGPLAIAPYLFSKYLINCFYPPNKMDFNGTPALHPLQRIALFGSRAYDSLTLNELIYVPTKHFWPEVVKFGLFHATVTGVDQLALHWDAIAFATGPKRTNGSMYDVQPPPFLNRIEILSDDDGSEEALIPEEQDDALQPAGEFTRFNDALEMYNQGKSDIRCENVKVALWYGLRATASMSAGVMVTAATTIWGGLHPEEWSDSLRLCFYGFTVLTTAYAVERGMENAHYVPSIGSRLSSCCASFFSRNNDNINDGENDAEERQELITNHEHEERFDI